MATLFTQLDNSMLARAIVCSRGRRSRGDRRSWSDVAEVIQQFRQREGLPPSPHTPEEWAERYKSFIMFRLDHDDLVEEECMVDPLPWAAHESETLQAFIPDFMTAGRGSASKYVIEGPVKAPDWYAIALKMEEMTGNQGRYTGLMLLNAYFFRILIDHTIVEGSEGPQGLAPEMRAELTETLSARPAHD